MSTSRNHVYMAHGMFVDETKIERGEDGESVWVTLRGGVSGHTTFGIGEAVARQLCEQLMAVLPPVPAEASAEEVGP